MNLICSLIFALIVNQTTTNHFLFFHNTQPIRLKPDLTFNTKNGNFPNYDFRKILELSGQWKFEIGDDSTWKRPDYNDSRWEDILVPSAWEEEGFPGYDGVAWYRTRFQLDPEYQDSRIYLYLGYIDDADEVYLNGHFIGYTGEFPPGPKLLDFFLRRYLIPKAYLKYRQENVLSVRVYDHHQTGGIVFGKIGLYVIRDEFKPDVDLSGHWKFMPGDDMNRKNENYDDASWNEILVPANWETQGYRDLDGFAWYRKTFELPENTKAEKLILLLGLIDDADETFLNGQRIGHHGLFENSEIDIGNYWVKFRAYYLPPTYLKLKGKNIIAVRVYDAKVKGGIFDGPIGIVTRDRYLSWEKNREENLIDRILRTIFGL